MAEHVITGVILAGGQSRRFDGGDKFLRPLAGRPVLAHVIERLSPQVSRHLLSMNGDGARVAEAGVKGEFPILPDRYGESRGPLSGLLTAMQWVGSYAPATTHLLTVAADCPFLPDDLAKRLLAAVTGVDSDASCARSGIDINTMRVHPTFALWPVRCGEALRQSFDDDGMRRLMDWVERQSPAYADWSDHPVDPFFNINTPADLATAEALLASFGTHRS